MEAVSSYTTRRRVPVMEQRIRIWEDVIGNKHKEHPRDTLTFVYVGDARWRKKTENFAVREKKGAKEAVATMTEEELAQHPNWRTDILRATTHVIPAYDTFHYTIWTSFWKNTLIAYYGVRIHETHNPSFWKRGTHILVNTRQTIVWSDVQTEECPHPMPVEDDNARLSHFVREGAVITREFSLRIGDELRGDPPVSHLLSRRTLLYTRDETIIRRPRQGDQKAKTLPSPTPAGYRNDDYPVLPLVFLTDFSTKAKAPSVVKPPGIYENDFPPRHDLVVNLEECRERRATLKQRLAEVVFHPARVERVATAYGVDFETYIARLDGDV